MAKWMRRRYTLEYKHETVNPGNPKRAQSALVKNRVWGAYKFWHPRLICGLLA
jgi:hypothetical protein